MVEDAPGDAPASEPVLLPFPPLPLQEVAEVKPAYGAGMGAPEPVDDAPQAPVGDDPRPPPPLLAQQVRSKRVGQRLRRP